MQSKSEEYQVLAKFINSLDKESYLFNWLNSEKEMFKSAMESDFFHADSIKSAIIRKDELNTDIAKKEKYLEHLRQKESDLTQKVNYSMHKAATLKQQLNNLKDSFDCLTYGMNKIET